MKSKNAMTVIIILISIIGLSLLLYPTVSDYVNSLNQSRAIASYAESVEKMDSNECNQIISEAKEYNKGLAGRARMFHLDKEQAKKYPNMLSVPDSDVIAYIEIPKINCNLPVYHGTDEAVLAVAAGHVEWSSLPVGGESSHCVISGHRGLPSAKLFTNLDQMETGDKFVIRVLNLILTYEVDQILIVKPDDVGELTIKSGKDYCTLVTCTPYGVNSHRLLVRGHRIENTSEANAISVTSDAIAIEPLIVAPLIGLPILIVLLIIVLIRIKRPEGRKLKREGGTFHERS